MTTDMIIMLVITLVAVAAIAALFLYLYRRDHPKVAKAVGRDAGTGAATSALRGFARANSFRFIEPAHIKSGEHTAMLNAVAVGYFGVLGVVALGYNGEIYGEAKDDEWLQVTPAGERNRFPNPIAEASAGVRAIRDVLFGAKLKRVPVEVVAVFTNPKAQLALPRSTGHYTLKGFKALLKKEKYGEDAGLDLDAVERAIKSAAEKVAE